MITVNKQDGQSLLTSAVHVRLEICRMTLWKRDTFKQTRGRREKKGGGVQKEDK